MSLELINANGIWNKNLLFIHQTSTCSCLSQYNLARSLGNVNTQFHCADFMSVNTKQSMGIQFSIQCHMKLNYATFYLVTEPCLHIIIAFDTF